MYSSLHLRNFYHTCIVSYGIENAIFLLYVKYKGVDGMKKRVTYTLEIELAEKLKKISEETMIPQAKLVEKAVEQVIKEYGHHLK